MLIRSVESNEKDIIKQIADLHVLAFKNFFLSSMHIGFLRYLYRSICEYEDSVLLICFDGERPVGFLAFTKDISSLYKFMLKKHLIPFAWYSFLSFLRRPKIFFKLFSALNMPKRTKRDKKSVKISSIGVDPEYRNHGIGTKLMDEMKKQVDFSEIDYVTLETDAKGNDETNQFYQKNGFDLSYVLLTPEGRRMNVYHLHAG